MYHIMTTGNVKDVFSLTLKINESELKIKPFVSNTLGKIIEALFSGLKALPEEKENIEKVVRINYPDERNRKVVMSIGEKNIPANPYVQEMTANTIFGFLMPLNDVPETFEEMADSKIEISYSIK